MIYVDGRVGSKELLPLLPKSTSCLTRLEYADVAFLGVWGDGSPASIGVERKTLGDLLSSMQDGRLAGHQLTGLTSAYDIVYIVVEGVWKVGRDGRLMVPRGKTWRGMTLGNRSYMLRELNNFLNTLDILAGVHTRITNGKMHTAMLITHLYKWWQKPDHKSHLAIHKHRFPGEGVLLTKPSLLRRVSSEIKGIGWGRSKAVTGHFDSVRQMVNAEVKEWESIKGIGKKLAKQAVEELGKVQ